MKGESSLTVKMDDVRTLRLNYREAKTIVALAKAAFPSVSDMSIYKAMIPCMDYLPENGDDFSYLVDVLRSLLSGGERRAVSREDAEKAFESFIDEHGLYETKLLLMETFVRFSDPSGVQTWKARVGKGREMMMQDPNQTLSTGETSPSSSSDGEQS
jgi:hypothetical protein